MKRATIMSILVVITLLGCSLALAATPKRFKNCTEFNKVYPHGVGLANAKDNAGKVFLFKRNTKLYELAISYNKRLDRDHDGIACEKV